ncbi:tyrosine-type recombinase/integrase [Haloarculaceae archaeon H-GB11]|nr:tyrosine-type recombinase/integrase [Haloarculaceae archaeon H-GB11]
MAESVAFDLDEALEEFERHIRFGVPEKERVAESTACGYKRDVQRFEEFVAEERPNTEGLLDVTTSDLRQYLTLKREDGDKPRTIVKRRSALSRFYGVLPKLAEDGVIALDPDAVPDNPEEELDQIWSVGKSHKSKKGGKAYLTPEEVTALYKHVPAPRKRNLLICKLLYQTGCRRNECATLRLEDVEPLENQEIVIRAENAKSGKERTVYYKESLIADLREWIYGATETPRASRGRVSI